MTGTLSSSSGRHYWGKWLSARGKGGSTTTSLRTGLLRHIVLPIGDKLFGQAMMQRLAFLEQAQWWPQQQIAEERDRLLQNLIRTAYHEVPLYRQLMDKRGVRPEEVRSPADLVRLPIATKAVLRVAYPNDVTRSTGCKTYEASTSGSTGANFRVTEDAYTAGWYRASFLLSLEWAGWHIGEAHLQTGITPSRSRDRRLKDALLACHYVSAYDLSDASLDAVLDDLDKNQIMHLWGYPVSLLEISKRAQARGWNRQLRTIVTWGDNLYPQYRATIEGVFGCRVTDTYGCGEGIQIAAQCGCGSTYHIHALDTIVETLDGDDQPVPPGTAGNIVLTRLHPGPMPLIRYRVGDVGTLAPPDETCLCGRQWPILRGIQGRDTDVITTPSGNRLIVHFFTGVLGHFPEIAEFQVVQKAPDCVTLRLVPGAGYTPGVGQSAVDALIAHGAAGLEFAVEEVDTIPLTKGGKRRFVIREIPTN